MLKCLSFECLILRIEFLFAKKGDIANLFFCFDLEARCHLDFPFTELKTHQRVHLYRKADFLLIYDLLLAIFDLMFEPNSHLNAKYPISNTTKPLTLINQENNIHLLDFFAIKVNTMLFCRLRTVCQ